MPMVGTPSHRLERPANLHMALRLVCYLGPITLPIAILWLREAPLPLLRYRPEGEATVVRDGALQQDWAHRQKSQEGAEIREP